MATNTLEVQSTPAKPAPPPDASNKLRSDPEAGAYCIPGKGCFKPGGEPLHPGDSEPGDPTRPDLYRWGTTERVLPLIGIDRPKSTTADAIKANYQFTEENLMQGALASFQTGKPLVVCFTKPGERASDDLINNTIPELKKQFGDQANFVHVDLNSEKGKMLKKDFNMNGEPPCTAVLAVTQGADGQLQLKEPTGQRFFGQQAPFMSKFLKSSIPAAARGMQDFDETSFAPPYLATQPRLTDGTSPATNPPTDTTNPPTRKNPPADTTTPVTDTTSPPAITPPTDAAPITQPPTDVTTPPAEVTRETEAPPPVDDSAAHGQRMSPERLAHFKRAQRAAAELVEMEKTSGGPPINAPVPVPPPGSMPTVKPPTDTRPNQPSDRPMEAPAPSDRPTPRPEEIRFDASQWSEAKQKAQELGRQIVVRSYSHSCPPCRQMASSWTAPGTQNVLNDKYVFVESNTQSSHELTRELGVGGIPDTVIGHIDESGNFKLDRRIVGYRSPSELQRILRGEGN